MQKKPLIYVGIGVIITIFILGAIILIFSLIPSNYEFTFSIKETEERINGDVYLNEEYLGTTDNGFIKYDSYYLHPGTISLRGNYTGEEFYYEFELTRQDLEEYYGIDYTITQKDLEELSFKASSINESQIENEIFKVINERRAEEGLVLLKRNKVLDELAKEYSEQMLNEDFFDHVDPQGRELHDRMNEKEIFNFMATEDISFIPVYPKTNIAQETVDGWIDSPGHRVPIMAKDTIWESVGIGVKCYDDFIDLIPYCYITAEFAAFEITYEDEIKSDYLQLITLYDEGLGLDFETQIDLYFKSDQKAKLILIENPEDYKKYLNDKSIDEIWEKTTDNYQDTISIKPNYGLIIYANRGSIEYTLELEYNAK